MQLQAPPLASVRALESEVQMSLQRKSEQDWNFPSKVNFVQSLLQFCLILVDFVEIGTDIVIANPKVVVST